MLWAQKNAGDMRLDKGIEWVSELVDTICPGKMLEKHRIDEAEFQQFRRMIRAYADLGAVLDSV